MNITKAEAEQALAEIDAWCVASSARETLRAYLAQAGEDAERLERQDDALHQIKQWSLAYPLEVFPEPDLARAEDVLKANGMGVSAISAKAMRHVITRVQAIVDAARAAAVAPTQLGEEHD